MANFVSGLGPLFGPDFVVVAANDETGKEYRVQLYPDANNPALRDAGLPTQYYFQPAQVYLARKHDTPDDYDFQMTLFKGLGTEETNITPAEMEGANFELGGGFCTFSTTFGIPPSVIKNVIQKLKQRDHPVPKDRLGPYFNYRQNDPDPAVGIVPITNSSVVCAVQDPNIVGQQIKMAAQYSQKGSIESQGISTFLVSCNLFAAGEIASALKAGASPPFAVFNTLQEAFYINGVQVKVIVDVDKVYDSFSAAVSAGSLFGITDIEAEAAWSTMTTTGGVTTEISSNEAVLDEDTKKWIRDSVDQMRKTATDLVKEQIFDWDPSKNDTRASASRGWFSEVFGGASVSVKSNYQRRSIKFDQTIVLNETIAVSHTVTGDLNDLLPAVRANLNKYLFVIDVGEFFKKVQVAARSGLTFKETLPDGTDISDPIQSMQIEVGYPDFSSPIENGQPNLRMLGQGSHYVPGQTTPKGPVQPAVWNGDNASDYVNISFLRLDDPVPQWPKDQVKLRRKIIFNSLDPRVRLSPKIAPHDRSIAEIEELTTEHAPILTASAVGYLFVRFMVTPLKLPPNIIVSITPSIGGDTYAPIVVTRDTQKDAIWEVFSDKYVEANQFTYTMEVEVDGPNFTDDPVIYSTDQPRVVPIAPGWLTFIPQVKAPLPNEPADKTDLVNQYVRDASRQAAQQ